MSQHSKERFWSNERLAREIVAVSPTKATHKPVQPLHLAVLLLLEGSAPRSLDNIALELCLPKSTAQKWVTGCIENGWIVDVQPRLTVPYELSAAGIRLLRTARGHPNRLTTQSGEGTSEENE